MFNLDKVLLWTGRTPLTAGRPRTRPRACSQTLWDWHGPDSRKPHRTRTVGVCLCSNIAGNRLFFLSFFFFSVAWAQHQTAKGGNLSTTTFPYEPAAHYTSQGSAGHCPSDTGSQVSCSPSGAPNSCVSVRTLGMCLLLKSSGHRIRIWQHWGFQYLCGYWANPPVWPQVCAPNLPPHPVPTWAQVRQGSELPLLCSWHWPSEDISQLQISTLQKTLW